jgi:hypothetical protein
MAMVRILSAGSISAVAVTAAVVLTAVLPIATEVVLPGSSFIS